jgi:hypothetical protein
MGPCSLEMGGIQMVETEFRKIAKHNQKGRELNFDTSTMHHRSKRKKMVAKHSYPRNI